MYAEAYVTVHQYDIVLDVTVINRTRETLQNLCLELATMGDLKLVERPQNHTLPPGAQKSIRCACWVMREDKHLQLHSQASCVALLASKHPKEHQVCSDCLAGAQNARLFSPAAQHCAKMKRKRVTCTCSVRI